VKAKNPIIHGRANNIPYRVFLLDVPAFTAFSTPLLQKFI